MSLIKSISGIRGTIGGREGDNLTCIDIVRFTAAYARFITERHADMPRRIVVGRDARVSGPMVNGLVCSTLCGMGFDVVDIGMASTPTTEIAVTSENAAGGIIITASHNPAQWNALKLLGPSGEFLDKAEGERVLELAAADDLDFAPWQELGTVYHNETYDRRHIDAVLALPAVDTEAIRNANLTVAIDAVNSVGGHVMPKLLKALGVAKVVEINCEATGRFAHTPEPIPENLKLTAQTVVDSKADVGLVVDPDVDRLAIIMENGEMFVEEYTLVSVADYVLGLTPGNTVSNLSSSRALRDVTARHEGCNYSAAAVGEVNVVTEMKRTNAIIGGEGNGGVIYPALHYGRDALVGAALFLTLLAKSGKKVSELKKTYPQYVILKDKIQLDGSMDVDAILLKVKEQFADKGTITDIDGVKIDFPEGWVHLRKSNTEPIIRIYSEAKDSQKAEELAQSVKQFVMNR